MKLQNPQLSELFKTPKRKTYTVIGATALLVGILILFSIRPTFVKIASLNKEIKDKKVVLSKMEQKLRTLNELILKKAESVDDIPNFEDVFPDEKQTGFIVANVAEIAKTYGLDLMSIEFADEKKEVNNTNYSNIENSEKIQPFKVTIKVEGNLSGVEKFIEYLEAFPRIFDIQTYGCSENDLSRFNENISNYQPISCNISMNAFSWNSAASPATDSSQQSGE